MFEFHVYTENKGLIFDSYGIDCDDVQFIKELIDHDLSTPDKIAKLQKPKRRFLYEVMSLHEYSMHACIV